jgi:hypothetical protein
VSGYTPSPDKRLLPPRCQQCDTTGCEGNLLQGRYVEGQGWVWLIRYRHHKTQWTQGGQPITLAVPRDELAHRLLTLFAEVSALLLLIVMHRSWAEHCTACSCSTAGCACHGMGG